MNLAHRRATETAVQDWTATHQTSGLTSRLILAYAERAGGPEAVRDILELCGLTAWHAQLCDESFWFDFDTKIRLFEATARVLDDPLAARHIGEAAVDLSVFTGVKLTMRAVGSPRLVYAGLARQSWKFTAAHRLEDTDIRSTEAQFVYRDISGSGYHALDCQYNQGMLSCVPTMFGGERATIRHTTCALEGADCCIYDVSWVESASATRRLAAHWGAASAVAFGTLALAAPHDLAFAAIGPALGAAAVARRAISRRRSSRRSLEIEARDQRELTERLASSLRDLVGDLRIDEVLGKVIKNAQGALPGREFVLMVATEEGLRCRGSSRVPAGALSALESWATGSGDLLAERRTLDCLTAIPALSSLPADPDVPLGALFSAPLVFRDETVGVLVALAHGEDRFLPQERGTLDAYADQAALALGNARLYAEIENLARTDPLTGLLNRREFERRLARELQRAGHYGSSVALLAIDLNGFKRINDERGHAEGDAVLRAVADLLARLAEGTGGVYRIGGDEFTFVLPGGNGDSARKLGVAVEAGVAGLNAGVSACSGAAVWPADGPSQSLLMFNADRALYEAKALSTGSGPAPRLGAPPAPTLADAGAAADHHLRTVTRALARAVDAKDSYTRSHCETVSELCAAIGEHLGLDGKRIEKLRLAGLLHDVGKIGTPDAILNKPDRLTEEEFAQMKQHSTLGHTIVLAAELTEEAVWVLHHHERIDGRGYPAGLVGEEIPLESRIILVADAFEAITSDRPYRKGRSAEVALAELDRFSGTQFDADCVRALRRSLGTGARELFEPGPTLHVPGSPVSG